MPLRKRGGGGHSEPSPFLILPAAQGGQAPGLLVGGDEGDLQSLDLGLRPFPSCLWAPEAPLSVPL